MFDSIQLVLQLAKAIYDAAQLAEANKEQSQLIARRVRMLAGQIKSLQGTLVKSPAKYERPLQLLVTTLQDCSEFIQSFKKKGFLSRMLFGASHEAKFAQYNADVDRASADLQLSLGIDAAARQVEDRKAAEADSKQLQVMLRLQQRQEGHMQAMIAKQDDMLALFEKFMALQLNPDQEKPSPIPGIKKRFYLDARQLHTTAHWGEDEYTTDHVGEYLGEAVYIKRLKNCSAEVEQHFIREIAVLSHLQHSHLLSFYGACFDRGHECLVFEGIKARSSDLFKDSMPPLSERLLWLKQLVSAVNYLHSRDIIHGDISPRAVVISLDDKLKLTNFGFAATQASTLKALGGSPLKVALSYLSPERFTLSHKEPTMASDVYSLGLWCWSLWTGKLPFTACYSQADKSKAAHQALLAELPSALSEMVAPCFNEARARPSALDLLSQLTLLLPRLIPSAPPVVVVPAINPEERYQVGLQAEQMKDIAKARGCYEDAVRAGHVKAKTNLAYFYAKGLGGVPKDERRAFNLLTEAAMTPVDGRPGHNRAMFNLGVCYQNGRGVAIDNNQARYWYQMAVDHGYKEARAYLDAINQILAGNLSTLVKTPK